MFLCPYTCVKCVNVQLHEVVCICTIAYFFVVRVCVYVDYINCMCLYSSMHLWVYIFVYLYFMKGGGECRIDKIMYILLKFRGNSNGKGKSYAPMCFYRKGR